MMNILITGASGFLGKFLCEALRVEGHTLFEVNSKNCNLLMPHSLHAFNSVRFDQIYHLAAWTQAGDFCLRHPGEQWILNQKINTHILSWWSEYQPQAKLICMGTSCAYDPDLPLKEENYLKGIPIDSLFTYAMTKRMLLCGLQALHRQYGLQYLYVIPSTLYGPSYHIDGRQMHFIFDLIYKILQGSQGGPPVVLWGDGEQKREVVHVRDFVSALVALVPIATNTLVNIGAGKEYSIKDFARLICTLVEYPFEKIHYDLSKYVGARSKVLSIEKLKKFLPYFSHTPLEKGIAETIIWFQNHLNFLSKQNGLSSQ